jgi:hypothetical protein
VNQLVKSLINIDEKFFNDIELLKILGPIILKNTSKVQDVCTLGMILKPLRFENFVTK